MVRITVKLVKYLVLFGVACFALIIIDAVMGDNTTGREALVCFAAGILYSEFAEWYLSSKIGHKE